jgi:dTDP-4-dehydrorhamnose reductase
MTSGEATVLVVGGDGQIGRELLAGLPRHGIPVLGTTRHRERVGPGRIHLDLEDDLSSWRCPGNIRAAVLAAAVTRLDVCEREPEAARRINVAANVALADRLADQGVPVIFLSSNQVFDGSTSHRRADEPTSPLTTYGRQKAEVERYLLERYDNASILRLTKVVTPQLPLLCQWSSALRAGSPVWPFRDVVMAPLAVGFVVETIARMAERRPVGVLQASGPRDVPYSDVALHIAGRLGVDPALVQPQNSSDAGLLPIFAPRNTTLDTARLREELGLIPAEPWPAIDSTILASV